MRTFEVDFQLKYENKIIGDQQNNINFHEDDLSDVVGRELSVYTKILKK